MPYFFSAFMLVIGILTSCSSKKQINQWDAVSIDPAISKDSIYTHLDKEKEILSMHEKQDSFIKRTSDVAYFRIAEDFRTKDEYSKFNNCRAHFFHTDTLSIDIGIGDGFGGQGFIISYKDRKFYTQPYYVTDVIISGEPEPAYKIVYQALTLDKSNYKLGDSLYGKIDFKCIETKNNETVEHLGKGYFRTKIRTF